MNTVIVSAVIAVLNSLWQAAFLAALVWLALRLAPRMNAATRFAIWWATLVVALILPAAPRFIASAREWFQPAPVQFTKSVYVPPSAPAPVLDIAPLVTVESRDSSGWPLWVAAAWGVVLLYRLAQIARSYVYLNGLKRRAIVSDLPLPASSRRARFLLSPEIDSPIAVGFARPAVILPTSLPSELSKEEMEHVLLHESAHLVRWDDWTNLLARMLGAALALHPVALWILRRVEIEREAACDDWVVAHTQSARPYAQSLARLYELRLARRQAASGELLAAGIFGNGSRFGERIESLLRRGRDFTPRVRRQTVTGSVATLLLVTGAVALSPRWVALAQVRPSFEVASVKRSNPDGILHAGMQYLPGGKFTAKDTPLFMTIASAYELPFQTDRIVGAPQWLHSEGYDIDALASKDALLPGTSMKVQIETQRQMVQSLLAERFQLKLRREIKEMPVYVLTVGKNGLKLPKAKVNENACSDEAATVQCHRFSRGGPPSGLHGDAVDMLDVARFLANWTDKPVIDKTGLTALYNVQTEGWRPINLAPTPGASEGISEVDRPSLFAVFEHLGLKLEPGKAAVEVFTIENVERPSEN